jgi:hypothetical protein
MNRSDIIGFEITRQFQGVAVALISPAEQAINQLRAANPNADIPATLLAAAVFRPPTVTLSPSQLESLIGSPSVSEFYAAIEDLTSNGENRPKPTETYANENISGTVLPPQPFPIPALQIAPVLRYHDILEIEKTAQHVVRNTTLYSKAVWMSMTAEERAILLEGYTIGAPSDGLADASQMLPLLNCVQNKVLGVFGNSLIMPFMIPQAVAEQMGIDPAQLQQALLAYQKDSFVPPHSTIALPTRGVLGEAVLGHCPSAEKIDLTRFWNWQDAPADTAPGIGMVQLPTTTPPLTTGVTAPNSLTNLPPLINNLITALQPNTSLLQAMGQQAVSQQDFSPAFTGQQQLANLMQNGQSLANQARADALKTSADLTSKAMDTIGSLVGKSMGASGGGSGQSSGQSKPAQTTNANKGGGTDSKGATQDKGSGTLGPGDFPINNSPIDKVTPGGNIDFGDAATAAELLA